MLEMSGLSEATLPPAADTTTSSPSASPTLPAWPTRLTLAAWVLLGVGVSIHDGEWSLPGLILVIIGFAAAVSVVAVAAARVRTPTRAELAVAVAASLAAAVAHPAERLMHARAGGLLAIDLLAAAAVGVALVGLRLRRQHRAWLLGAAAATAAGVTTIAVVGNPHIDVWFLLQQSSDGLRSGANMYQQHWQHSHGLQAVYPYLPLTTVLLAPFRWVTTDVRAGLLVSSLLTSWQLRRWVPAAPAALALLLLVHPHWTFVVDQSWTEPLLLVLLTSALLAVDRGRPALAVVALAAALACKQHIVLLLPLFALWPSFGWRRTLGSAALAVVAMLPWVLWSPSAFWHDAVKANLDLGVIPRALCIPTLLLRHGIHVGFWFPLVALALAYLVVVRRLPRTTSGLAFGCAIVLWTLDLTNKQSFFNHYTLPLGLLVVALTAASAREEARR
jgi:hypothetical protein